MIKKVLLLLIIAVAVFIPKPALAVTQTSSDFEVTWDDPLFAKENILPGDEFEATVKVTNLTNEEQSLKIQFENWDETSDGLSPQIEFYVFRNSKSLLEDNLDELFDQDEKELLTMDPKEKDLELSFKAKFRKEAGNEYQGKGTEFDIILGAVRIPVSTVLSSEAEVKAEAEPKKEEGKILGMAIGPLATGADLLPSILASLAAFSTGLYLRRRSFTNPKGV